MKSNDFNWKDFEGIVVISPGDYLDVRNGIGFKEFVEKKFLGNEEIRSLVLDLSEVKMIDSFIIGIIVALYKKFQNEEKGFFILCSKESRVEDVLKQYTLDRIIPIKNDLKEVLEMIR